MSADRKRSGSLYIRGQVMDMQRQNSGQVPPMPAAAADTPQGGHGGGAGATTARNAGEDVGEQPLDEPWPQV
jgi:hypothetical protein